MSKGTFNNKANRYSLLDGDDSDDDIKVVKSNNVVEPVVEHVVKPTNKTIVAETNITSESVDNQNPFVSTDKHSGKYVRKDKTNRSDKDFTNKYENKYENKNTGKYNHTHGNHTHGNHNYNKYGHGREDRENDNGFVMVSNKKKDKPVFEHETKDISEFDFNEDMPNKYRVLVHHIHDKNWDFLSYHNITTLQKWIDVPRFFNTLDNAQGECRFTDFDIYLMKNEITPMWEDPENRNGSICSIKIDTVEEGYEIFKLISYYTANNNLLKISGQHWEIVNGLSFSKKSLDHLCRDTYCIIIKIYFRINMFSSIEKYFNDELYKKLHKYSIKLKPIKPEY